MRTTEVDWLAGGVRRTVARSRIEAAAADLFLERGIERVSIDDVAERVGCSWPPCTGTSAVSRNWSGS